MVMEWVINVINNSAYFTSSLVLQSHPMKRVKHKIKNDYYAVLKYFVTRVSLSEFTDYRLKLYYGLLNKSAKG